MKANRKLTVIRTSALANRIVDALMKTLETRRIPAKRLQVRGPDEEDLGGWCRDAAVREIEKVLSENFNQ